MTAMAVGEPPEEVLSDSRYFYYSHGDHLGSSHILTEGKGESRHSGVMYRRGQLLQRFEYAPFGQETYVLNPNLKFDPSYTGQTYDIETGLYYYKARYYNPKLARFIQPDTIVPDAKNLQAYNKYSYVINNPYKYTDPSGHGFWDWFKRLFGAFIGALISVLTFGALLPAGVTIATMSFGQAVIFGAISGMAGGFVGGAISGGVQGAFLGAAFGLLGGAAFGALGHGLNSAFGAAGMGLSQQAAQNATMAVMAGVGVGLSYATGGWKGLVSFGAGILGGLAGKGLLGALKGKTAEYAQVSSATDGEDFGDQVNRGMVGGGIGRSGGRYYRYVGQGEADLVKETGTIPNTRPTVAGNATKNVFYTNQNIGSATEAQNTLSLPVRPTHRITIDPAAVRANYGGFTSGGGVEFITRQPIRVDPLKIDVLK